MDYQDYYKDHQLFFHKNCDIPPHPTKYGMHAHEIYEFYYLLSGNGTFTVEGNKYLLNPNSIMLMRSNEAHYLQMNKDLPYERIVLHFFPQILDQIDPDRILLTPFDNRSLGVNNFYPSGSFSNQLVRSCLNNILEVKDNDYKKRVAIITNLLTILNELNKSFHNYHPQLLFTAQNSQMTEVISYINEHLFENISIESICKQFYISKSQLNTLFKKATNTTVWKYIITKRLISARHLLYDGVPAVEACMQCGFKDYSTFYRRYRDFFGTSPQDDIHKV
ncbi:helix-turn-helix domain-containing protein [Gracilibacillus salitolerans]|uniref:Helix-turn-helix domain-containing protein n=1 Tax=Gracilibacillus salitolerans TaxID=2663022 RepID=A0A5Q2TK69_9BACI|nr:AraC family transcriptional regulator [Gracilibacillus salitolerans]QGH34462.1 helix-turn-helix domain-containing protein [Gracilibacillus salitolerans]